MKTVEKPLDNSSENESEVAQSCPTICAPVDCSPPGSSVHGILQARVLGGLPFPSPGDLPDPGIKPRSTALQADTLTSEPPRKPSRPFRCDLNQIPYDYTVEETNRFKGLDLIDRVPEELWKEVVDIVQETGIKTIPKKMKCKKTKWLSEEGLQIAEKRRQVKSKGEKDRYTLLNAEFQRIARRDKKAFLSDHCKEIEENNRMGRTRDLFEKIRDTKGTFHAKMGSIKDRNCMGPNRSRRY